MNLVTHQALDFDKPTFALVARTLENSQADKAGYTISGLGANTWDLSSGGRLGLLANITYSDSSTRTDSTSFLNYADASGEGIPGAPAGTFIYPTHFYGQAVQSEPEVTNFFGSVQYAPNENAKLYLDAYISDYQLTDFREGYRFRIGEDSSFSNVTRGSQGQLLTADVQGVSLRLEGDAFPRIQEVFHYALGGEVTRNNVTYSGEVTYYETESSKQFFRAEYVDANRPVDISLDLSDLGSPVLSTTFDATNINNFSTALSNADRTLEDSSEITAKFDINIDWDYLYFSAFRAGLRYADYERNRSRFKVRPPSSLLEGRALSQSPLSFDSVALSNFLPKLSGHFSKFLGVDVSKYQSASAVEAGLALQGILGGIPAEGKSKSKIKFQEETWAAYAMLDIDTQVGSLPLTGNIGVRIVTTDVDNEGLALLSGGLTEISRGGKHTNVLPSLNLALGLTDDLLLRFGAAQTMARPDFGAIAPGIELIDNAAMGTGKGGNPALEPFIGARIKF